MKDVFNLHLYKVFPSHVAFLALAVAMVHLMNVAREGRTSAGADLDQTRPDRTGNHRWCRPGAALFTIYVIACTPSVKLRELRLPLGTGGLLLATGPAGILDKFGNLGK